jgi:hypothetical protein
MDISEINEEYMMTLSEHRDMGKILKDIRNSLAVISVKLDKKYGKSKGLSLKLDRAARVVDKVRSQLDDCLFNEYPDLETEEGCRYYY